jgi:glycosyltransferase involved in cell wall biosynthesis
MLPHLYDRFVAQGLGNSELIVVDDSVEKCPFMETLADSRVRYIHLRERRSTGEKRNLAVDAASGQVIVQFDDDDYYSPQYIRTMIGRMQAQNADFVKLSSFFLYSKILRQYGYWETEKKDGLHFVWDGSPVATRTEFDKNAEIADMHLGYGFSYVFKKTVWEAAPFPPIFFNQDTPFIKAAIANGFRICLATDETGLCLHILHGGNASISFPQYIFPDGLGPGFFDGLDSAYLE